MESSKLMNISAILLGLLCMVPFSIFYGYPPYPDFLQDMIVILFSAFAIVSLMLSGETIQVPRISLVLLLMSLYWLLQMVVLNTPYKHHSLTAIGFFSFAALLGITVQTLATKLGKEKLLTLLAFFLLAGAVIQSVAVVLQATNTYFPIFFHYNPSGMVEGQLGQRNLTAHYMMWGCIASAYLISVRKVSALVGWLCIISIGAAMVILSSRSIVLYLISLLIVFVGIAVFKRKTEKKFIYLYISVVFVLLIIQYAMPIIYEQIGLSSRSGLNRLISAGAFQDYSGGHRLTEWHKAWLTFKENPIFGVGYNYYGFQGFVKDIDINSAEKYRMHIYFPHSHNILTQLLAEMGFIGCALVVIGGLWVVLPILKRLGSSENVFILSVIIVTSCHSMVEFPLWYSFFFIVFIIFLSVCDKPQNVLVLNNKMWANAFALVAFAYIILAGGLYVYNQLQIGRLIQRSNNMVTVRYVAMTETAEAFPFLFTDYIDEDASYAIKLKTPLSQQQLDSLERFIHYRQSPEIANKYGFVLYQQGKIKEAEDWMEITWHYYPRLIPESMRIISENLSIFRGLKDPVIRVCKKYKALGLYPDTFDKITCSTNPEDQLIQEK